MSIAAVGYSSAGQASAYAAIQQRMKAFKTLASSIQSGDLADAQKSLATIQQDMSGAAQNSTISTDFTNLSDALKSGDAAEARKAFATLQQDLQKMHGHHGKHHGGGGMKAANATQTTDITLPDSTAPDTTSADAVGGTVNIQA